MSHYSSLITRYSLLLTRLLLAALLLFGSEVLAWNNPTGRPALEWLLILPGYIVLSAVLLDFIVRYRMRDLFGILVLAGVYSLSAAILLNPQSAFADMPRTLITRVMGAHGLLAAEMIGLFLALTGGDAPKTRRYVWIGSLIVGMAWGFWVKGWPADQGFADASLTLLLAYGIVGVVVIWALARFAASQTADSLPVTQTTAEDWNVKPAADSLKLSPRGWGLVVVVIGALVIVRLVQGGLEGGSVVLTLLLLVLTWAIIWFRGRTKGATLLDGHFPPRAMPLPTFVIAAVLFIGAAVFTFNLPPIKVAEITPLTVIGLGFTAYGLAWLPTVSLILGARAYLRQVQTQKL